MLYLTGIAIDFFLMLILASKKNKSEADKILALWLFCIGLHLTFFYLFISKLYFQYPQFLGVEIPFPLLHGPLLYLYTSYLTDQVPRRNTQILHFIPFVLAYVPLFQFILSPADEKIYTYSNSGEGYETLMIVMSISFAISMIVYIILSLLKLKRHRINIAEQFSNTDKINLLWLRYLILGMCIIWVVFFFWEDQYTFAAVVMYIFFIGYYGIKQTPIFITHHHYEQLSFAGEQVQLVVDPVMEQMSTPDVQRKYETSGLSQIKKQAISHELEKFVETEKVFRNADLSLDMLAEQLHIHPNYLSQYINEELNLSFYDYINSKRVEEFKRAIHQPENSHLSMLGLALECGFNSKSSFNRNFKKFAGQTPSEYMSAVKV